MRSLLAARTASVAFGLVAVIGLQRSDDSNKIERAPTAQIKPVSASIDATATSPESAGVVAVCNIESHAASPSATSAQPLLDRIADWSGARVVSSCSDPSVAIYACRTSDGLAVCIANHAADTRELRIAITLPRGAYSVERRNLQADATALPGVARLPGRVVDNRGIVPIRTSVAPALVAILLVENRNLSVAKAYSDVAQRLRSASSTNASLHARLRVPLGECSDHIAALGSGIRPSERPQAIAHVHRAILTVAHAQSLAANAQSHVAVIADLNGALDRLAIALGELSACCLNLVPEVSVVPGDDAHPSRQSITATLRNCGGWRVTGVRLGVSAAHGCAVRPAEEAVFASLGPGQSVRATFTVDTAEDATEPRVEGSFGFVAQKSPAQVRLRPL
jgi:hypothetical protein